MSYLDLVVEAALEWRISPAMEAIAWQIVETIVDENDQYELTQDQLKGLLTVPDLIADTRWRLAAALVGRKQVDEKKQRQASYMNLRPEHRWCLRVLLAGSMTAEQERAFCKVFPHLSDLGLITEDYVLTSWGKVIAEGIERHVPAWRKTHPNPLVRAEVARNNYIEPYTLAALFARIATNTQHGYDPQIELLIRRGLISYHTILGKRKFYVPEDILTAWKACDIQVVA